MVTFMHLSTPLAHGRGARSLAKAGFFDSAACYIAASKFSEMQICQSIATCTLPSIFFIK